MSIGYLAFYCHAREVQFRLLTCSITSVTFVFELNLMSFCPDVLRVTCFFPHLFVRLLVLFFVWVVSAHVSAPYVIVGSAHDL